MSKSLLSYTRSAALLLVALATAGTAQAVTGDYFSSFGRVYNDETVFAPDGECAAASFINGAIYLKNHYPATYGSTNITTGGTTSSAAGHASSSAATAGRAAGHRTMATIAVAVSTAMPHVFGDLWDTTVDWMQNSFAPGKTAFSGQAWTARSKESTSGWPCSDNLSFCTPTYDFMHNAVTANNSWN